MRRQTHNTTPAKAKQQTTTTNNYNNYNNDNNITTMARNTAALEMSSDLQRKLIEQSKISLLSSFDELETECEIEGTKMYHDNQEATAMEVADTILNDQQVVFQLVKAMTQTGKTGCMLAVIRSCFTLAGCNIIVNPKNIFIITGISSTDWKEQTKTRFPTALKENIYHRGELAKKLKNKLTDLRDVVILMDEVHVASKHEMTISQLFQETGLRDMEHLRENNINIVEFSATPNKIMEDLLLWGERAKQHIMQPGPGYKGIRHQLENGRVFQAKDLYIADDPDLNTMDEAEFQKRKKLIQPANDAIRDLKNKIITSYDSPRYHIVRLPNSSRGKYETIVGRFMRIFGADGFRHHSCHSKAQDNDVQNIIQRVPVEHTLIYIKEHLRCAVTLQPKTNVGILYDRISINDDVMIQGLSGRATGYDVPDDMLVYTNIESLNRYMTVWDSEFTELAGFTYQGSRTRRSKPTVMHPDVYANTGIEPEEHVPPIGPELNFVIDLTDEDFASVTSGKNSSKKNKVAAMEIIQREAPESWEKYSEYTQKMWRLKPDDEKKYKKWGIASRLEPGSMTTTTNIKQLEEQERHLIFMYVLYTTKQLIVSPWSGQPKQPAPEMTGGAAEQE